MAEFFSTLTHLPLVQRQEMDKEYTETINSWLEKDEDWWRRAKQTFDSKPETLITVAFALASHQRITKLEITNSAVILPLVYGVILMETLGKLLWPGAGNSQRFMEFMKKYVAPMDSDLIYLHGNLLRVPPNKIRQHRHFVFSRLAHSPNRDNYGLDSEFCSCINESEAHYCGCTEYLTRNLEKRSSQRYTVRGQQKIRTASLRHLTSDYVSDLLYRMRCAVVHETYGGSYMYIYEGNHRGAPRSTYGMTILDAIPDVIEESIRLETGLERARFEEITKNAIIHFLEDTNKFR